MAYIFGAFVSLCAGVGAFGFTGFVGSGIAGAAVFLISVLVIRGWERIGYEADVPGNEDANIRSAATYSASGPGGAFHGGSDGGGGFGGDGGGGGSC